MIDRRLAPLVVAEEYPPPPKASRLTLERCDPQTARTFIAAWHSRLPQTQRGPWQYGFIAHWQQTCYGAALWHNPSARTLPQDWVELRRLAIPEDAPPHTASWMLGAMRRWFQRNVPDVPRLISYQDRDVHTGTIYKAAGWVPAYVSEPRVRDRTPNRATAVERVPDAVVGLFGDDVQVSRVGTGRKYRSDLNGQAPAGAGKVRWEVEVCMPQNIEPAPDWKTPPGVLT